MEPVSIVTIKEILPLYKGEEKANNVELIHLEEAGFDIVSQKGLYKIGDKAVYILPDYCVSNIDLFQEFIAPKDDESKSYLGKIEGKPRRIRAKKFSLHKGDGLSVYSNGILLTFYEVCEYLQDDDLQNLNLTKELNIIKYEVPEERIPNPVSNNNSVIKPFPNGVYKTDETNINLLWDHIEKNIGYPIRLIGTEKVDGSSISIGITDEYPDGFITSRNVVKQIYINKIIGRRQKTLIEKLLFWITPDLNIYEKQLNEDDAFVKAGFPYLNLMNIVSLNNIILRGELNGGNLKGSGNKNNPSLKEPVNIKFFNADNYINGIATKMNYNEFNKLCNLWEFPKVNVTFIKEFKSREEIEKECEQYFANKKKSTGEIIEGIVLKTEDCMFSAKYMNNEYDSKK